MNNETKKVNFNSFLDKTDKSKKSICFIDSLLHFKKIEQVKTLSNIKILFLINEKTLIREMKNSNYEFIYFENYLSLIKNIFKLRKENFNFLFAACVDQMYFQLIFFLCRFSFFATIDEGIFSVDKLSRFNSEKKFKKDTHKLYFYLEKIFNFPKAPNFFIEKSIYHFGWFNKNLYEETMLEDKVILMDQPKGLIDVKPKIFIGQPFKWMGLDPKNLDQIINFIKNEKIDFYLKHPRETKQNSILSKINCPVINIDTDAENFLNIIYKDRLCIFSFMSSVIFGISNKFDVNIICLPVSENVQVRHDAFLHMLKVSEIQHTVVPYVR
tara:strand:+ start:3102 stop:4079 length:978 start_codon:yes stop_codon:yes gene_type:complete